MKRRTLVTCAATVAVAMLAFSGPAAATPFPGPDGFGYTGAAIPGNLRNVSVSGTFVPLGDDEMSSVIGTGFTFNFYGTGNTQLVISSNGFVTFDLSTAGDSDAASGCCRGLALPTNDAFNNLIAGFWEDLNSPQGNIRHQTLGSAPNREFVVGFYSVPHFDGGPQVTFEMILHEGSDAIELQYGAAPADADPWPTGVGIEDATGTNGLQVAGGTGVSFNNQGFLISAIQDGDGDGIPDNLDACVNSDLSATVVIDGCGSGVANALDATGCTIADGVGQCAADATNHGKFVSCVAHLTNDLKKAGAIRGRDKGAIQRCAAQADLP